MGEDFKEESLESPESPAKTNANEAEVEPGVASASVADEPAPSKGVTGEPRPEVPDIAASDETSETASTETEAPAVAEEPFVPIEEFESLRKEKDELYERLLRKQAEFENFRKRSEREKQEFYEFALANFLQGVLPVLDGLERGLSVSDGETVESYKKGIELILKQFRDQLASAGVQPIRAIGKMFDPNLHQAVLREESAVLPENEIIEEMQRGYTFKERLLRPSMVKVAVAPALPEAVSEVSPLPAEEVTDQEPVQ